MHVHVHTGDINSIYLSVCLSATIHVWLGLAWRLFTLVTNSYHRGNRDQLRILYGILDFTPLLDSATIKPTDWIQIAECVHDNYNNFEGFVILHGTNTMAYTSSALSFMLEGLGKAVVLTGSEYPLTMPYTDLS